MQTDPSQDKLDALSNLYNSGQTSQVIRTCKKLLKTYKKSLYLLNLLGAALQEKGKFKEAIRIYNQMIQIKPDYFNAHYNLGFALQGLRKFNNAVNSYNRAIQLNPDYVDAHGNLGNVLKELGRLDEAINSYNKVIQLKPDYAEAYNNLGNALRDLGRLDEAINNYNKAIQLNPDYADAYNNMGTVLQDRGQLDEALRSCNKAIQLKPDYAEAYSNLGSVQKVLGQFEEATKNYNKAIQLKPSYAGAHFNLGLLLLLQGNFKDGWEKYEHRCQNKDYTIPIHNLTRPQWDGTNLKGVLLVYAEQGLGDVFQFSRYLRHIKKDGGSIVLMCQSTVVDFYHGEGCGWDIYIDKVISLDDPLPHFDLYVSLMSLPYIMGENINDIPQDVHYIKTHQDMVYSWKSKIKKERIRNDIKVGFVWQGDKTHKNDYYRSIPLENFTPLLELDKAKFFSLQKGFGQEQIAENNFEDSIIDWSDDFDQYINTAALIENLDLVISVDTSIAHLAGAMGKPVWVLLEEIPDFRWMLDRKDSPWYPSVKLFRQKQFSDWSSVIAKVKTELESLINKTQ